MYVCIPQPGWAGHQSSFLQSRDKQSRSNIKTKNPFPSPGTWFCRLSPFRLSLASVSPPGACTSLPAPGLGLSPPPIPVARGGTLTPKDASAEMAALSLLSSCFLYIASGTLGLGRRG